MSADVNASDDCQHCFCALCTPEHTPSLSSNWQSILQAALADKEAQPGRGDGAQPQGEGQDIRGPEFDPRSISHMHLIRYMSYEM